MSNCVNPFKKDVFQFPGLPPPPIGSLPVRPHRHPVYTSWHLISYFRIINISNARIYICVYIKYVYVYTRAREKDRSGANSHPDRSSAALHAGQFLKTPRMINDVASSGGGIQISNSFPVTGTEQQQWLYYAIIYLHIYYT